MAREYELMVCGWERNPRHCVYLNNRRIAGSKPWGGAHDHKAWTVTLDELGAAVPEIREMREALERLETPAPGVKKLPPWAIGIIRAVLAKAEGR
jgi:hypothetical protein